MLWGRAGPIAYIDVALPDSLLIPKSLDSAAKGCYIVYDWQDMTELNLTEGIGPGIEHPPYPHDAVSDEDVVALATHFFRAVFGDVHLEPIQAEPEFGRPDFLLTTKNEHIVMS